jgi:hypothetical protein
MSHELSDEKKGRPVKLSLEDKRFCVRSIKTQKCETAKEVQKSLKSDLNVEVSERTVRRVLSAGGMKAADKKKKPLLSKKNRKTRLAFAKRHKDWTVEDWKRVIWSDETKINRFGSDGRSWCWLSKKGGLDPRQIKETVKFGGGSLMIWGCMTAYGPGFSMRIEGTMDQHQYLSILKDGLLPTIGHFRLNRENVIFQHDNDPKHKARSVSDWLKRQPFSVLEWPAQSPDLNPIEHLWAMLKKQLNGYDRAPTGMLELWERVSEQWGKIDKLACLGLIESMPRRIQAVIKAKGGHTKY